MKDYNIMLHIAKDEIDTLITYADMLENSEDKEIVKSTVDEIMGDEFNHALIALLSASKLMEIKIATDDISENPNDIEVK